MVNWTQDDLTRAFDRAGLLTGHFHVEQTAIEILVTDPVLSRWFPEAHEPPDTPVRPSYRERLAALLTPDQVDQIRRYLTERLAGKQIRWITESIHVVANRK
jgi:hypothetical protein